MNIKNLARRIDKIRPKRLVVLGRLPDGTERELTGDELVEIGADFVRVLSGNDLRDLDLILSDFKSRL